MIGHFMRHLAPLVRRMWPSTFEGLEHLPAGDRFLVVANHSGMGIAELWALILAWHETHPDRPVAGMAIPGAFEIPPVRYFLQGLGAVEATREGAAWARQAGVPLLLFPGGDHEATRPLWQARRVDWNGRKGWIRLAREHRLSIVPMCIRGSHVTLPIVARGRALSWLIGTRALGVHRAPLPLLSVVTALGSLAAARAARASWWVGPLAAWASVWATMALPWVPSRITFRVLPPIPPEEVGDDSSRDSIMYERVVAALQHELAR